jgi:hypothetical protein
MKIPMGKAHGKIWRRTLPDLRLCLYYPTPTPILDPPTPTVNTRLFLIHLNSYSMLTDNLFGFWSRDCVTQFKN